ncbi:unnamed protein product [Pieris macdunnoughi]|uniref:Serpin domain-containing protein n=1 Tax=Pieris macdunnoughi TaxID=345717 RepID=A0A821MKD9_9NEOP|nr:unnamed protein product [Pieris macdunnoughi]
MGVFDLFEKKFSEFYGVPRNTLFVPAILQHVSMKVNEVGLRRDTAQTANRTVMFDASRPFLYFVIEKTIDTIVLSGVYSKPTVY